MENPKRKERFLKYLHNLFLMHFYKIIFKVWVVSHITKIPFKAFSGQENERDEPWLNHKSNCILSIFPLFLLIDIFTENDRPVTLRQCSQCQKGTVMFTIFLESNCHDLFQILFKQMSALEDDSLIRLEPFLSLFHDPIT